MLHRLLYLLPFAALAPSVAWSDLSRIDADGVTETGGTPAAARMLTRTGPNGRLAASLLPPVADWASQPISNLYYVSGIATVQGNGSPQYPFNTLTYALAHVIPGSAVLLAPASYSGALALGAGQTLTLVGFGAGSRITSLTVSAAGSSSSTELRLCGIRVDSLNVTGGRLTIRLSGAQIGSLTGTSTQVAIVRTDLGATVLANAIGASDTYTGYDTVQHAKSVVSTDGTPSLALSTGRARLGTEVVSHLSDLAALSNRVDAEVADLVSEDSRISALVATEAIKRASGDITISNVLNTAVTGLMTQIGAVGSTWGRQLTAVSGTLGRLEARMGRAESTESNDVRRLEGLIDDTEDAFAAADAALASNIRGETASSISLVRSDLSTALTESANDCASKRYISMTNAVEQSKAYTRLSLGLVTNRLAQIDTQLLSNVVWKVNTYNRMSVIEAKVNEIITQLDNLRNNRPWSAPTAIPASSP